MNKIQAMTAKKQEWLANAYHVFIKAVAKSNKEIRIFTNNTT
jgi:hypothetical protein